MVSGIQLLIVLAIAVSKKAKAFLLLFDFSSASLNSY
jgi:hypothetical protein